jgi:DNA-binding response OmpR family regulator
MTSAVTLLRWPRDAVRRDELAARGRPCLLLIEDGVAPPHVRELEDWMRVPADERDLLLRVQRLELLASEPTPPPAIDEHLLRANGLSMILSPAESALVTRLLADFERVVTRADLERAVWAGSPRSPRALDSLVARCRKRLHGAGHTIAAVRGRGFTLAMLEADDG